MSIFGSYTNPAFLVPFQYNINAIKLRKESYVFWSPLFSSLNVCLYILSTSVYRGLDHWPRPRTLSGGKNQSASNCNQWEKPSGASQDSPGCSWGFGFYFLTFLLFFSMEDSPRLSAYLMHGTHFRWGGTVFQEVLEAAVHPLLGNEALLSQS